MRRRQCLNKCDNTLHPAPREASAASIPEAQHPQLVDTQAQALPRACISCMHAHLCAQTHKHTSTHISLSTDCPPTAGPAIVLSLDLESLLMPHQPSPQQGPSPPVPIEHVTNASPSPRTRVTHQGLEKTP